MGVFIIQDVARTSAILTRLIQRHNVWNVFSPVVFLRLSILEFAE